MSDLPQLTGLDRRLLERVRDGRTPRCSIKVFKRLTALLPGLLQLESRDGADARAGYVLTPLRDAPATNKAIDKLIGKAWKPDDLAYALENAAEFLEMEEWPEDDGGAQCAANREAAKRIRAMAKRLNLVGKR
jgi:hypothetical protein